MRHVKSNMIRICAIAFSVFLLSSCDNGSSKSDVAQGKRSGESYLYISPAEFYFSTQNVGSTTTQPIDISNRGADVYELSSMRVVGNPLDPEDPEYHPDEFAVEIVDTVVLEPAQSIRLGVSFKPLTEQQKQANFVIDYETIVRASPEANNLEQRYYNGLQLEQKGDYGAASRTYRTYLDGEPQTVNKRLAATKLPIVEQSTIYGKGSDLKAYLTALNQRNIGDAAAALKTLDLFNNKYRESYLADDALYLSGYIQLMDLQNSSDAIVTMRQLRTRYPDTTYYDTSIYSEAIAQKDVGNKNRAKIMLTELQLRHTGMVVLGVGFSKDNLLSRLWFNRARDQLKSLDTA